METTMRSSHKIARRDFIKLTGISGAFLVLGCTPTTNKNSKIVNMSQDEALGTAVNQYIFIDSSGGVTLFNHRPEMGQGTFESIPMILAEELEVQMDQVRILPSPADHSKYGDQMVVGSHSIRGNFDLMRKMGAAAKAMLVQAAANKWQVSPDVCRAENAMVIHKDSEKRISYGELVEEASKLEVPENPPLKDPTDFKIIGTSHFRSDIPMKTNGAAKFGLDMQVPGMLYASVERCPMYMGKIISFDDKKAKAVPGVKYVVKTQRSVHGRTVEGVAVVADSYWSAQQGRKVLEIQWDNGDLESNNTENIWKDFIQASAQPGVQFEHRGQFEQAYSHAERQLQASYQTPYQAHATMEPMNAIVSVAEGKCAFWGSTQNPNGTRSMLAEKLQIPEEKVEIHYTFLGGGLGRRGMTDVAEEAADISRQVNAPVKVVWSREDDISQGPFRACSLNVLRGAVSKGNVVAFEHKVICQDIRNQLGGGEASGGITGGINTDYAIPNFKVNGVLRQLYIPINYWRSVYHSTNCFAHESFVDELAHAAGKDPVDLRLSLLTDHRRYTQVLKTVAEKSDWHTPRKPNIGKGVAIVERSGAFVAMVVEIARVDGHIKLAKVTAAIDCGVVVNPDTVKAQAEGCVVMGLTAAYKSGITFEHGKVAETNFDTYHMLRYNECPEIEIHVVESQDPPEGAGEPGLPTVAPALTNAIFELTGKRIRKLPFKLEEV